MPARFLANSWLITSLTLMPNIALAQEEQTAPRLLDTHPLTETIWDVKQQKKISLAELESKVKGVDHVMLGEKHDNPRHHEIQAHIIDVLGKAGQKPFVVFEMIGPEKIDIIDNAELDYVKQLGVALEWKENGWPDWSIYQPIAEKLLSHGMNFMPGAPSYELLVTIGHGAPMPEVIGKELRWNQTYNAQQAESLMVELEKAHCNQLERISLEPLAWMQRLKDATMGAFMRIAEFRKRGSVLIAGTGHTRQDRGAPWFLDKASTRTGLAMYEVVRGETDPTQYPEFDPALHDYIWFTARVDEKDPCEEFKDQLDKAAEKFNQSEQ